MIARFPRSVRKADHRLRGQVRRSYGDQINDLWQSFESMSGPHFDDSWDAEPPPLAQTHPAAASYSVPDLSAVPISVLEAHIAHMKDAVAGREGRKSIAKESPRPAKDAGVAGGRRHAHKFKTFAFEANKLHAAARQAAFVGQDIGAGQSASKATEKRRGSRGGDGENAYDA